MLRHPCYALGIKTASDSLEAQIRRIASNPLESRENSGKDIRKKGCLFAPCADLS
ncbi:MAG: hypothetical protein OXE98_06835 [Hyphomicrobiales bacterium]|nr:hypothetical protein [Hyphomicrobiales bacterium]